MRVGSSSVEEHIEPEAVEVFGAAWYERTDSRVTEPNDVRPRTLSTKAGYLELPIPTPRKGVVLPADPRARGRIDWALYAVVTAAYVVGRMDRLRG